MFPHGVGSTRGAGCRGCPNALATLGARQAAGSRWASLAPSLEVGLRLG